jgi:hypothetical protein
MIRPLRGALLGAAVLSVGGCMATVTPQRLVGIQADPVSAHGQYARLNVYPYDEGRGHEGVFIGCLLPCPSGPDDSTSVLVLYGIDEHRGWRGDRMISLLVVLRAGCALDDPILCERFPFYFEERIEIT